MKAIKVTQELKDSNPKVFGEVGSIYSGSVPKTFVRGEDTSLAYDTEYDLQVEDGWQTPIEPALLENQVYNGLEEVAGEISYKVRDLTEEEIALKGQITMPRNDFKLALLRDYGVKNSDVDALFDTLIANSLAKELQVEEMKILWYESTNFRSTTPELFQFAATLSAMNPSISITEADLKQIFTDYAQGV